ncbi:MAG: glycine cleavage system protein T [Bdellovibrionales bacterium RBG_16_40_8]|nr:MAG: glycine cleavage system protein T [Bdellovibrionales bacterium RBG_16_40_8]
MTPKATPLKEEHLRLGAKMVDFVGWLMPVEYTGIRAEHEQVRNRVGIFDVSHMGEIRVRGNRALETLQWLTTNDVSLIENGKAQYNLLINEAGGIIDDIIVYCIEKNNDYFICVNASNTEKDWAWINSHNRGAELTNESALWGQIAVQGPMAVSLVSKVFGEEVKSVAAFNFSPYPFSGALCYLARTGYTGEDGFEIFVPTAKTVLLWRTLFELGEGFKVKPIGLGARDTLRTEMKYCLYGHELDDTTNPYAAGLGWIVKPDAKDFIGKEKIQVAQRAGLKERLVGFKMVDKGIARHGYRVLAIDNREIGRVTSGTVSPTLGESIGIAYISTELAKVGQEICIDIRGRAAKARVVKTPFVQTVLAKNKPL